MTTTTIKKGNTTIAAIEIKKAAITTFKIETMATTAIEENMMDADAINKEKGMMDIDAIRKEKEMMDTDAIKKEMGMMDTNAIRVKEKSKDVSQQKGEDMNIDCIYDNSQS